MGHLLMLTGWEETADCASIRGTGGMSTVRTTDACLSPLYRLLNPARFYTTAQGIGYNGRQRFRRPRGK
jgi:hypothetical protein